MTIRFPLQFSFIPLFLLASAFLFPAGTMGAEGASPPGIFYWRAHFSSAEYGRGEPCSSNTKACSRMIDGPDGLKSGYAVVNMNIDGSGRGAPVGAVAQRFRWVNMAAAAEQGEKKIQKTGRTILRDVLGLGFVLGIATLIRGRRVRRFWYGFVFGCALGIVLTIIDVLGSV